LQSGQPVAQHAGPLELEVGRRFLHIALQLLQWRAVAPFEKVAGGGDMAAIVVMSAGGGTGAEAVADLVADAAGGTNDREQFLLIGEDHLLRLRAIAEPIPVVEPANRFPCPMPRRHGAEARQRRRGDLRGEEGVWCGPAAETDPGAAE